MQIGTKVMRTNSPETVTGELMRLSGAYAVVQWLRNGRKRTSTVRADKIAAADAAELDRRRAANIEAANAARYGVVYFSDAGQAEKFTAALGTRGHRATCEPTATGSKFAALVRVYGFAGCTPQSELLALVGWEL